MPQVVNVVKHFSVTNNGARIEVKIVTMLPSNPQLNIFCCDPINVPVYSKRRPSQLIHGFSKKFPCEPKTFLPVGGGETSWTWRIPSQECGCPHGHFVIFEPAIKPKLSWTSAVRVCPPAPVITSYHYLICFTSSGATGYVPNAATIAQGDASLATVSHDMLDCGPVVATGRMQLVSHFQLHTRTPPVFTEYCGFFSEPTNTLVTPFPEIATPGVDNWYWWLIAGGS